MSQIQNNKSSVGLNSNNHTAIDKTKNKLRRKKWKLAIWPFT